MIVYVSDSSIESQPEHEKAANPDELDECPDGLAA